MTAEYEREAPGYTMTTVMQEAARCLLCEDAPCSQACPAHTDPAKFIRSVRFQNVKGAAETIRENNALGAICARVCPTERYCESACTRAKIDGPIDIGGIQRYVTDQEQKLGMQILKPGKANGMRVAIVGTGPAGLQAATTLLQKGYAVEMFEKQKKAGGYLTYGIPEYRLPTTIVDYEVNRIVKLGAKIHYQTTVGQDVSVDDLKADFAAVIVAIGQGSAKALPMFDHNICTEPAIAFLARAKEKRGQLDDLPDNVLVIGGGDVAMDVVTTLKKLGVPHVTDVVYEAFDEFKASKKELVGAQAAGVTIIDDYVPTAVHQNQVTFKHRAIDATLTLAADKIILAVGQKVAASGLDLDLQHNELPYRAARYHTKNPQVFVTGDLVAGDQTVVVAVQKGKEVAEEIDQTLRGEQHD